MLSAIAPKRALARVKALVIGKGIAGEHGTRNAVLSEHFCHGHALTDFLRRPLPQGISSACLDIVSRTIDCSSPPAHIISRINTDKSNHPYLIRAGISCFVSSSAIAIEHPHPAGGAPYRRAARTWFTLTVMRAQRTAEAEPFQQLRVMKEAYRAAAGAMRHVALLRLEDTRFCPAAAVKEQVHRLSVRSFSLCHRYPPRCIWTGDPTGMPRAR